MMNLIRRTNYLISSIRLFIYRTKGLFQGTILQRIPINVSLTVKRNSRLQLSGSILCRGPGYISVSGGVLTIENKVFINTSSYIVCRRKITIGEGCVIGPSVCIVDHDHDYKSDDMRNTFKCDEISIGKNVWIGANAVILRGTHIGNNCVIGAGTVVKGDIEEDSIVLNNRDVQIKTIRK